MRISDVQINDGRVFIELLQQRPFGAQKQQFDFVFWGRWDDEKDWQLYIAYPGVGNKLSRRDLIVHVQQVLTSPLLFQKIRELSLMDLSIIDSLDDQVKGLKDISEKLNGGNNRDIFVTSRSEKIDDNGTQRIVNVPNAFIYSLSF